MNFSSPLTVLSNRETRVETCFERVPAPERFFPPKSHRFALKGAIIKTVCGLWLARKDLATH